MENSRRRLSSNVTLREGDSWLLCDEFPLTGSLGLQYTGQPRMRPAETKLIFFVFPWILSEKECGGRREKSVRAKRDEVGRRVRSSGGPAELAGVNGQRDRVGRRRSMLIVVLVGLEKLLIGDRRVVRMQVQ